MAQLAPLPRAVPSFSSLLREHGLIPLARTQTTTVQVNVGKRCNQACKHCHVDAGPNRSETMNAQVADRILSLVKVSPAIDTVDITGGAPELNANFRSMVARLRNMGIHVIDRCNLTILFQPQMMDLDTFLAQHHVHIIASLPCYSEKNVDKQRGRGVFNQSIAALRRLNHLGYGQNGSSLELDLVYNPIGPYLPPDQHSLQEQYKKTLWDEFGVHFNQLRTITNLPVNRFADHLHRTGAYEDYMNLLVTHFNPHTVSSVMCRTLISVDYQGNLYDCDFNQMQTIPIGDSTRPTSIWDISSFEEFDTQPIATGPHCLGCTAGAGSSCGGALANKLP